MVARKEIPDFNPNKNIPAESNIFTQKIAEITQGLFTPVVAVGNWHDGDDDIFRVCVVTRVGEEGTQGNSLPKDFFDALGIACNELAVRCFPGAGVEIRIIGENNLDAVRKDMQKLGKPLPPFTTLTGDPFVS